MINIPKLSKIDFLVLIAVATIGIIHLPFPFSGDQALFTTGALEMQQGKILYRDFWDLKQPGIYYFYFLAGNLFGFNEIGIHIFELIYMMLFSIILQLTLKPYFQHPIIASLVPLLTVGVYYISSYHLQLTQVEGLVGFPLFLCLWLTYQSFDFEGKQKFFQLLLSGFVGGIVLIFKLIFLPIILAFWLTILLHSVLIKHHKFKKLVIEIFLPIFIGIIFPILGVVSYFVSVDSLAIVYKTFFVYPSQVVANGTFSISKLLFGTAWFLKSFITLIFLAIVAINVSLRQNKNLLTLLFVVWFIFGLAIIFLQTRSLWSYHYLLLFVPTGILAAKGLDILWQPFKESNSRIIKIIIPILFLLPLLFNLQSKIIALVQNNFALTKDTQLQYQAAFRKDYALLRSEVEFLSQPGNLAGEIFVAGDPSIYYLSRRTQATSLNAWSLELFLSEQWPQLLGELDSSKPAYIFIFDNYQSLIKKEFPKILELIDQRYRILSKSNDGIWYILN
ncbi:MAG: glycosyltransferase family 39 protein [Nostoc sp. DedVER02]|uniref:glycosyltransferase family 39 protein n=1 Tax=unclassified Nostoc TaxID=2593658 RepID=UPI002AD43C7F|nr:MULTISPECIES: glycosyltransferase family 39 protein [unclassified Nostoc]MDZ7986130.1 glycosyltransferase family 39 protein [Nostoc sp. DedVER02]MDZ8115438.1 glycosyltransferase family 39 protein [Nostoc sp. DedVER01b]